jgi:hypothetical protein
MNFGIEVANSSGVKPDSEYNPWDIFTIIDSEVKRALLLT